MRECSPTFVYARFGEFGYALLYQADVRTRLAHMGHLHRKAEAVYDQAVAAGTQANQEFDPDRLWNHIFIAAAED